ncbi:MAG: hypothetical protein N2327_06895 [Caldimicrobium sp.]|nr:hypothetical protein [Caldimicrobium sp.]
MFVKRNSIKEASSYLKALVHRWKKLPKDSGGKENGQKAKRSWKQQMGKEKLKPFVLQGQPLDFFFA